MAGNTLSQAERDRKASEEMDAAVGRIKEFAAGVAKAVTTDLPGFLMDLGDKISGKTSTLGERDNSGKLFEKLTGVKSTGSNAEVLGGFMDPKTLLKAMILPAVVVKGHATASAAKAALDSGIPPREVWKTHGVYQDPASANLLAVIPDTTAALNPNVIVPGRITDEYTSSFINPTNNVKVQGGMFATHSLKDTLIHPELYHLVPDIMEDTVVRDTGMGIRALGSYTPTYKADSGRVVPATIRLGDNPAQGVLSTTLHEVQHAIQDNFALPQGGNPGMFRTIPEKELNDLTTQANSIQLKAREEFDAKWKDKPGMSSVSPFYGMNINIEDLARPNMSPAYRAKLEKTNAQYPVKALAEHAKILAIKQDLNKLREIDSAAVEKYRLLAGEAQSRLVQKQHKLGDYTTYPPDLYDVPLNKLIDPDYALGPHKVDTSNEIVDAVDRLKQLIQTFTPPTPPTVSP